MGLRNKIGDMLQRVFPPSKDADPNHDRLQSRRQQSFATGHAISFPRSDHNNENLHFRNWNYVAGHTLGKHMSQASVVVGYEEESNQDTDSPDSPQPKIRAIPDHPVAKLLNNPNGVDSIQTLLYRFSVQCSNTGGAYIWEPRNQLGLPMALWVIPRGWLWPVPTSGYVGEAMWRCTPNTGVYSGFGYWSNGMVPMSQFMIPERELIRIGYPDPVSPAEFTSPLDACSDIFDINDQAETTLKNLLLNAPNPGMILSMVNTNLTREEMERMVDVIQQMKGGANNAGKTMLLSGVEKYEMGGGDSTKFDTNLRDQNKANIFSIHGVPMAAGGEITDTGSYSAFAVLLNGFSELNVQPRLDLFGGHLTMRYRRRYNDDKLVIKLHAKRFDDPSLKMQKGQLAVALNRQGMTMTVNEGRAFVDMPPLPDGDVPMKDQSQQQAMQPDALGQLPTDQSTGVNGTPNDNAFDESAFALPDDESAGMPNPLQQRMKGLNGVYLNGNGVHK